MQRRQLLIVAASLFGAGVSASLSKAVLAGAKPSARAAAAHFSESELRAVELLCDMIIPATDTPGALEAGVADFIACIVFDWYREAERAAFIGGLKALDDHCLASEQTPFASASQRAREAALGEQAQLASGSAPGFVPFGGSPDDPDAPFFSRIKALVVLGYYTSEIGATQELIYMPVPGEYKGDVDFAEVGRQWTY